MLQILWGVGYADEVLTKDSIERGVIEWIKGDGKGGFELKIGSVVLNLNDVGAVHFARRKMTKSGKCLVAVVGGSRLYVENIKYDAEKSMFQLEVCDIGKIEMNANMVRAIFVPENIKDMGFIEDTLKHEAACDTVFLTTGSKVEGTLTSFGTDIIGFNSPSLGGEVSIKVKEIMGVVLTLLVKEGVEKGEPDVALYTLSGNLLRGVLTSATGEGLKVKTRAGELSVSINAIETIGFYRSDIVYLSDIEPFSVKETPFFDRFLYPYQRDRSLEKKAPISMRGNIYRKGISVHSKTELTYRLDGQYKRFMALIGIDDEAMGKGNVDFAVIADGKTVYEKKGVTGRDAPSFVKLNLSGVKEIVLVVDFGEQLDILDRAVWADAILMK
jgi:hypothetical protein